MNRFRIRVCDEARQRGDRTDLELTASAALLRASTGLHGVGFVADPRTAQGRGTAASKQLPPSRQTWLTTKATTCASERASLKPASGRPADTQSRPPHTFAGARPSPPRSPSKPTGPLDRGCPAPRLRPIRSPDLPAVRTLGHASAGDDDQLSFSATDYSDDFADPNDEIYTDFSIIFGGPDGGEGDGAEEVGADTQQGPVEENCGTSEHFEDYMDDLDGIPWDAR